MSAVTRVPGGVARGVSGRVPRGLASKRLAAVSGGPRGSLGGGYTHGERRVCAVKGAGPTSLSGNGLRRHIKEKGQRQKHLLNSPLGYNDVIWDKCYVFP